MKVVLVFLFCVPPIWSLITSRIIGGEESYAGEFPYAAAIYKSTAEGTFFCTGSILNKDYLITAGQCVDGATLFTILIGTHKLDGDAATVQRLTANEYVLHPDYNPLTLENDIGLIKFRTSISFDNWIRNLYLPFVDLHDDAKGRAYGWGQTTDSNSSLSNTLNTVYMSAVSNAQCRISYGAQIGQNMVCFEGSYNEGTCYGDSGSPILQHVSRGYDVIIAVASFFSANGCETTDPSGYTKVFPYNEWIRSITAA